MVDHRMEALEDRVSVRVKAKKTERNPEGGCHIHGVYRKPGATVKDLPLSTAKALQAKGYAMIVGSPKAGAETAAEK